MLFFFPTCLTLTLQPDSICAINRRLLVISEVFSKDLSEKPSGGNYFDVSCDVCVPLPFAPRLYSSLGTANSVPYLSCLRCIPSRFLCLIQSLTVPQKSAVRDQASSTRNPDTRTKGCTEPKGQQRWSVCAASSRTPGCEPTATRK
ncbi:hypothetical protein BJX99DRAFT_217898 [Aspergillus californicus]